MLFKCRNGLFLGLYLSITMFYSMNKERYNYADTDSGLGRATPPRRAPSPGVRHLPSPSGVGPGSLPPSRGLYSSGRRGPGSSGGFDDAASDVSSAAGSFMMDHYNGNLYKLKYKVNIFFIYLFDVQTGHH